MDEQELRTKLIALITYLASERSRSGRVRRFEPDELAAQPAKALWDMFRALVNTREPMSGPRGFYETQDEVLQFFIHQQPIATVDDAESVPGNDRMRLWRGDITRLRVDAIVNAANSQMLGCWVPGHYCIDNAIHTFAGVQLREECARLMIAQGHEEPTGRAKVTDAYNLPCEHVIHTVGPIADGHPTNANREELRSSYESCLEAALGCGAKSLAFCCISTGVFGFPQREAAKIATNTVQEWLQEHPSADMTVMFNVFTPDDYDIYRAILKMDVQ